MKKRLALILAAACLLSLLSACGSAPAAGTPKRNDNHTEEPAKQDTEAETPEEPAGQEDRSGDSQNKQDAEAQTISGVVNRLGEFLVLLDSDGEYHIFDFGEGVDTSGLEEGDRVTVTYTGVLDQQDPAPAATAIEKTA